MQVVLTRVRTENKLVFNIFNISGEEGKVYLQIIRKICALCITYGHVKPVTFKWLGFIQDWFRINSNDWEEGAQPITLCGSSELWYWQRLLNDGRKGWLGLEIEGEAHHGENGIAVGAWLLAHIQGDLEAEEQMISSLFLQPVEWVSSHSGCSLPCSNSESGFETIPKDEPYWCPKHFLIQYSW